MKTLWLICIVGWCAGMAWAQAPDTIWTRTYGSPRFESTWYVNITHDGGFVLCGDSFDSTQTDDDGRIVCANTDGDSLWGYVLGGPDWETCTDVRETPDHGFIACGFRYISPAQDSATALLLRFNSTGQLQWRREYAVAKRQEFYSLALTPDGGYVITGDLWPRPAPYKLWIVKTDGAGNLQWQHTYDGGGNGAGYSVINSPDGGYTAFGFTETSTDQVQAFLVKTNANGDSLWSQTYGGSNDDFGFTVRPTNDNGYILAAYTASFSAGGDYDCWLLKTDIGGHLQWQHTYGGSGFDKSWYAEQTLDGGYIVAALTNSFSAGGDMDMWLLKTNAVGDTEWTKTIGGPEDDVGWFVHQISDGNYIMSGDTRSYGAGDYDFWLVKLGTCNDGTPIAPQVTIKTIGSSAHLYWQPITQSASGCLLGVTHYLVYHAPLENGAYYYLGLTTDTTYVHTGVVAYNDRHFYKVIATTAPLPVLDQLQPNMTEEQVQQILSRPVLLSSSRPAAVSTAPRSRFARAPRGRLHRPFTE